MKLIISSSYLLILSLFSLVDAGRFSKFGSSVGSKLKSGKKSVGKQLFKAKKAAKKGFNKVNPFKAGLKGNELSSATREQMSYAQSSGAYCLEEKECDKSWTSNKLNSRNWMSGLDSRDLASQVSIPGTHDTEK